jgi:tetratricopeptide (TPR) repeat protein
MTLTKRFRACLLPIIFIAGCSICLGQTENYDEMIKEARALMKEEKLPEAKAKADEAVKIDPKRYEAFAVIALIDIKQGDTVAGKDAVAKALQLAPAEKKASLEALQKKLAETGSEIAPEAAKAPAVSSGIIMGRD